MCIMIDNLTMKIDNMHNEEILTHYFKHTSNQRQQYTHWNATKVKIKNKEQLKFSIESDQREAYRWLTT